MLGLSQIMGCEVLDIGYIGRLCLIVRPWIGYVSFEESVPSN